MSIVFDDLMQGLHEISEFEQGKIMLRVNMVEIAPIERFSASDIRKLRMTLNMSKMVFALVIGVSEKTIESWESGINHPNGSSSRLMQLIKKSPDITQTFYTCKA